MSIEIKIQATDLKGFSPPAREQLQAAIQQYATDIIDEANRVESGRGSAPGVPEVTRGMVDDAVLLFRRGLGVPKRSLWTKFVRVVAAVLTLLVGFLYDPQKLQKPEYMAFFVVVVAIAIIAVTVSTLKE